MPNRDCACGKCGLKVGYVGHYRRECKPAGFKNPERIYNKRRAGDRLVVKKAAADADVEIPALTKPQMYNATKKAIVLFDENFLRLRKQNKGKGLIFVSIAVSAEGLHPSGSNSGCLIVKELKRASLWNNAGMANLVRLVTRKGISYYENPTVEEQKRLGAPGELLFNAEGNKQLAMHVEKVLQVYLLNRETREHQAFTADSRAWFSETRATIQSWVSFLLLGNNRRNGICFQRYSLQ
jgi:hypothetical protein